MPRNKLLRRCNLWWCDSKHYANGLCEKHNARTTRYGTPVSPKNPEVSTLLMVIDKMRWLLIHHSDTSIPEISYVLGKTENQQRLLQSDIGECGVCEAGYTARVSSGLLVVDCNCGTEEFDLSYLITQRHQNLA
jgi:hypothetical protein